MRGRPVEKFLMRQAFEPFDGDEIGVEDGGGSELVHDVVSLIDVSIIHNKLLESTVDIIIMML